MKALLACVLVGWSLGTALASTDSDIRRECVRITAGYRSAAARAASPVTGAAFDRTLELEGIRFHVTSANEGSINTLRIVPSGLEIDNSPIVRTINGTVTNAEVADLNADGSPEIYVYVTSAGSGSYGSLVAYSANRRKSLSEIYLPPVTDDKEASRGYMGHDEFAVVKDVLVRRFPVYRDTDTNAKPTGGTRQLRYKLVPGEAGWILKLDHVNDVADRPLTVSALKKLVIAPRIFTIAAYVIEIYDRCPPCPPKAVCETCVYGIYVADDNRPRQPGSLTDNGLYLRTDKAAQFQIGTKYLFRIRYQLEKSAAGAWRQTGPQLIDFTSIGPEDKSE